MRVPWILGCVWVDREPSYFNESGINPEKVPQYIRSKEGDNDSPYPPWGGTVDEFFPPSPISWCPFPRTHLVGKPVTHHVKMGRTVS